MKVLFATNHAYPPQHVGGAESSTHDLCVTLGELGHEAAVLCSSSPRRSIGVWRRVASLRRDDRAVVREEALGYPVLRAQRPAAAVARAARDLNPDVAVVYANRALALAERLTDLGVPSLVYVRDASFADLGRPVLGRPDIGYVTTSVDLGRRFAESFGIVAPVVPPIVRPDRYKVDSARRNVTFVCPFAAKGVEIALDLAARRPDIPFVFVESWELHPARRLILDRRLRNLPNITYRGPTEDMRSVYREAKLVLVPSRVPEGWGRVVSEAQVSGIPALATDYGALREAVGPGGILVDARAAADQWLAALSRLWDDPVEYQLLARLAQDHAHRLHFQPTELAARLFGELSHLVAAASLRDDRPASGASPPERSTTSS